jgi:hypothetical protein
LGEDLFTENNSKKGPNGKKALRLIRCECGFEILLVPDLATMARAIEDHARKHGQKEKDAAKAAFEEERIIDNLTSQTLSIASEQ